MHPNTAFHWSDRAAMRAFVEELPFGTLFATTPDGPRVAHLPVVWLDESTLGLHLARGNALTRHLEGATALFVASGPEGYVSPDWYGLDHNQVPTWNYVAVELEGPMHRMEREALTAQIDGLSEQHEARLDKAPWTRDKMDAGVFTRMLDGIVGFSMEVRAWRGTLKLGQNKPEAARLAAADSLEASGRRAIAHLMRNPPARGGA
jgi:transcriptional regulator